MQTKLHRWHVAFTLDPVFFVVLCCGVASPLPALLYCNLLHWRAPLPRRFSIILERPQIFHQADGVVGIHFILSLLSFQMSLAIAASNGWRWDAQYVHVNMKIAIEMHCFQNCCEQQRHRSLNNGHQWARNEFEQHEQQVQRV